MPFLKSTHVSESAPSTLAMHFPGKHTARADFAVMHGRRGLSGAHGPPVNAPRNITQPVGVGQAISDEYQSAGREFQAKALPRP
jgi:hypothetical protein